MIKLPQITLCALTGTGYKTDEHVKALRVSCKDIEFGEVKLIQLDKIKDIDSWNEAVIYDLPKYIDTDYCMFIHHDGYIIHPELWQEDWLQFDFLGAAWPLPTDSFSYRDTSGTVRRVGNSVSLRSKKLMDLAAKTDKDYFWSMKEKYGNTNEDGYICCHNAIYLEEKGCKFAPLEVAVHFSKENTIEENKNIKETFCFHKVD